MAWNTSCRVMNSRAGPCFPAPSPPRAKAAGRTAIPARMATMVSETMIIREFLTRLSFLLR